MSPIWKMESTFTEFTSSVTALITERDPGYKFRKLKMSLISKYQEYKINCTYLFQYGLLAHTKVVN